MNLRSSGWEWELKSRGSLSNDTRIMDGNERLEFSQVKISQNINLSMRQFNFKSTRMHAHG